MKLKRMRLISIVMEPLASGFCIFHDKDYLQDKTNNEQRKRKVLDRLKHKANHAISNNEPLLCMDFLLPEFRFSDLNNRNEFTKPVYFSGSQFFGKADFSRAIFQEGASFLKANFRGGVYFSNSDFYGKTYFSGEFNSKTKFNYVLFERKEKVIFDIENLSNVSFINTDITGIRFSDKAKWGREKPNEDRFKIVDERILEDKIKKMVIQKTSI